MGVNSVSKWSKFFNQLKKFKTDVLHIDETYILEKIKNINYRRHGKIYIVSLLTSKGLSQYLLIKFGSPWRTKGQKWKISNLPEGHIWTLSKW